MRFAALLLILVFLIPCLGFGCSRSSHTEPSRTPPAKSERSTLPKREPHKP
jgi:hypothetical protein